MHYGKGTEKFFWTTFSQTMVLVMPSATFKEKSVNITTKFRFFFDLSGRTQMVQESKFVIKLINGDSFFPSIILKTASDEGLREEESTHPENFRSTFFDPLIQEFDSV